MASLVDLQNELPHGFHDSYLQRADIDYARQVARLHIDIWVGDMSAPPGDAREAMRPAIVSIEGLAYFIIEAPDEGYGGEGDPLRIVDVGPLAEWRERGLPRLPHPGPEGCFEAYMWVNNLNASIYVCGRDATLQWADG